VKSRILPPGVTARISCSARLDAQVAQGNGSGYGIHMKSWHPEFLRLEQCLLIYCPADVGRKERYVKEAGNVRIQLPGPFKQVFIARTICTMKEPNTANSRFVEMLGFICAANSKTCLN